MEYFKAVNNNIDFSNTVCHLNDSLISRCTLYNSVYRIIQQQYRTGIGMYATDFIIVTGLEYFAIFNFCGFYRPAKFRKNLTTAENTRYTVLIGLTRYY